MRKLLLLSSFVLVSGCVTIPNTETCSVAGKLLAGGICAESLTQVTRDLSFEEYVDFLEALPERPDPKDPTKTLPAKGAAVCQSLEDAAKIHDALEKLCRSVGNRCSYEEKKAIENLGIRLGKGKMK